MSRSVLQEAPAFVEYSNRATPVAAGTTEKLTCPTTFTPVVRSIWKRLPPFDRSSAPPAGALFNTLVLTTRGTKNRRGPAGPWAPAGPAGPAEPGGPGSPWIPCGPGGPWLPAGPCGPVDPIGPWGPVSPWLPCGPCGPAGPVLPC